MNSLLDKVTLGLLVKNLIPILFVIGYLISSFSYVMDNEVDFSYFIIGLPLGVILWWAFGWGTQMLLFYLSTFVIKPEIIEYLKDLANSDNKLFK